MSGLCFIFKPIKRVFASQINYYVSSTGLKKIRQLAYKLGHLTETVLLSNKNDVHLALASGEATAIVLLDQSAALDTIEHGTLLDCLSFCFCIGGPVLDWFKSYLSDRLQFVNIGSILSDAKKLLFAPSLVQYSFLIFRKLNNIHNLCNLCSCYQCCSLYLHVY